MSSRTRGIGAKQIEDLIEATNILIAQSNILLNQIGGILNPVDVSDRAARLLGIVYGNLAQLQQRPLSFDLYAALRYLGAEIDPRDLNPPTTVFNGQVTIAAPRVPLAVVVTAIDSVTIENVDTNDVVYVGNATVIAGNGYRLQPGATVSLDIDDLNKVNVAGTVGNVVSYLAVN